MAQTQNMCVLNILQTILVFLDVEQIVCPAEGMHVQLHQ